MVSVLAAATAVKAVVMVAVAASVRVDVAVNVAEVVVAVNAVVRAVAIVLRVGSNAVSNVMIHAVRAVVVNAQPAREKLLIVHRVKADVESVAAEAVVIVLSVVSAHHAAMQRLHPTLPLLKT